MTDEKITLAIEDTSLTGRLRAAVAAALPDLDFPIFERREQQRLELVALAREAADAIAELERVAETEFRESNTRKTFVIPDGPIADHIAWLSARAHAANDAIERLTRERDEWARLAAQKDQPGPSADS